MVHGGAGAWDRKEEAVRRPLPFRFYLIVMPAVLIVNQAMVLIFGLTCFDG